MKVLVFGDGDSIWIKSVIEYTLIPFEDQVTLLSRTKIEKYLDFYYDNNVEVIECRRLPGKIGTIFLGITNKEVFKKEFDIYCAHYVDIASLCVFPFAKKNTKKTIVFFWGSDILRAKKRVRCRTWLFNSVDRISIGTNEMLNQFHRLYGNGYDSKIRRLYFGVNGIEALKNVRSKSCELRKAYNIDEGKIVIAIGYNKMRAQQHIEALEAIKAIPEEQRKRIHLLLRLTYGNGDQKYVNEIKKAIRETGCSSSVFESYLTDEEVAEITSITDIFVQAQITDARSASMQEHLYSKCVVIHPSWIHYSELENKVFYLTYNNFEELTGILQENLVPKENSKYREKLNENAQIISQISSWSTFVPAWRDIYLN